MNTFKKALPYFISIIVFYLLTVVYFNQELLKGKSLPQSDVIQFEGMSKRSVDYRAASGEESLWNDAMFSGMPDYLIATGMPETTQTWLKKVLRGFFPQEKSAHLLFTLFVCFWIMLLTFEVPPYLALLGTLAFSFGSYNIINIEVGHVTKTWAIAFSGLVIGGINLVFRDKKLLGFGLTSAGLALQVGAAHYQITFYLIFVCLAFAISELIFAIKKKVFADFSKKVAVLLLAVGLAAITVTGKLWITQEYSPFSNRGVSELATSESSVKSNKNKDREYAFNWSQGKMETLTLLVPYFAGGSSSEKLTKKSATYEALERIAGASKAKDILRRGGMSIPLYHGNQPFTGGPLYAGAIICFLFVLGLLVLEKEKRYWLLAAAIITIIIAWGKNFQLLNYFLYDNVPGFNKFRSVSMALSMTFTVMSLTTILGLQKVFSEHFSFDKKAQKKFLIAFAITGGLAFLVGITAGMGDYSKTSDMGTAARIFGQDNPQVLQLMTTAWEDDRGSFVRSDAFRSFFLILIAAVLLWFGLKGKISQNIVLIALGVLLVGELWQVDKRYLHDAKFQKNLKKKSHQKSEADIFILKDNKEGARVLNLQNPFNDASLSYYHKSVGGYHAAKLKRYQDLIERQIQPEIQELVQGLQSRETDFSKLNVLNMLNARYFTFGKSAREVITNNSVLGHAWFVSSLKKVNNPMEEIQEISTISTATTAVIDASKFDIQKTNFEIDSTASIKEVSYNTRHIKYESNSNKDGFAVFSEIYYPKGWIAKIDGKETDIKRVNYVLRALEIPKGKHIITFDFEPRSYIVGSTISKYAGYLSFLSLLLAVGFVVYREVKKD